MAAQKLETADLKKLICPLCRSIVVTEHVNGAHINFYWQRVVNGANGTYITHWHESCKTIAEHTGRKIPKLTKVPRTKDF